MKYYGELRDINTQIVIATSDICKCENEARRVIAGEAFIRHFVKANTDAQDGLCYISKDGKRGLYYCCK